MTEIQKTLALRSVPAFAGLRIRDLMAIARVAEYREFAPGARACPADGILRELVVVVFGELLVDNTPAGAVIGLASLLKDRPLATELTAGATGAECLVLGKGHFFTVLHQCPELVRGLLGQEPTQIEAMAGRGRAAGRTSPTREGQDALFV